MVGAGVLGLPAALSHLGWVGGAIFLIFSLWARYVSGSAMVGATNGRVRMFVSAWSMANP
jgi:amino acid permease